MQVVLNRKMSTWTSLGVPQGLPLGHLCLLVCINDLIDVYDENVTFEKLNPVRPGGGGGLRGPDDQTHSCQSETSHSVMPKLCDF